MSKSGILLLTVCWGALAAGPAKIVLVAGKPSHGPGEHEFNAGTLLLAKCLRQNEGVDAVAELVEDDYEVGVADEGWAGRCGSLDGG